MGSLGKVRRCPQSGRDAWFLDFHPALRGQQRFSRGDRGHAFESEKHAKAVLAMGRHSDPKTTLGYTEEFGSSRDETRRAREALEERQRREDRVVPLRIER